MRWAPLQVIPKRRAQSPAGEARELARQADDLGPESLGEAGVQSQPQPMRLREVEDGAGVHAREVTVQQPRRDPGGHARTNPTGGPETRHPRQHEGESRSGRAHAKGCELGACAGTEAHAVATQHTTQGGATGQAPEGVSHQRQRQGRCGRREHCVRGQLGSGALSSGHHGRV